MAIEDMDLFELSQLAEEGDPEAQYRLGGIYYSGDGVTQDYAAAAKWFGLAADHGHPRAQFNLGFMSAEGEGVMRDPAEALKLYKLAAEQGLAVAQNNLGRMYEVAQEYGEAAKWYSLAAQQGYAPAQASLGFALSNGRGIEENQVEAAKWYQVAAEKGDAIAQLNLGIRYQSGRGITQDDVTAEKWLRLSAEQGNSDAQNMLGGIYAEGMGVTQDYAEALKWHRHSAEQGNAHAQLKLGFHYEYGHGVSQDWVMAYMWFALAAAHGNEIASKNRDRVERLPSYDVYDQISKAVAGDLQAQRDLAICLKKGEGIQSDQTAATVWLKMAAEGGDPWAQTTFAIQLRATKTPENEREGVRWLSMAVEQGDPLAMFTLGLQQFVGRGTHIDFESAAVNFIMASLAGINDAKDAVNQIRSVVPEKRWESIFERVQWPFLTFLMGPLAEGHLDGIRQSQENDDGTDDAPWLKYERESADTMFSHSEGGGSILDGAFGEKVTVSRILVGRAIDDGKVVAAITVNMRDIILKDGFPVYWHPSDDQLKVLAGFMGLIDGRNWVRAFYTQY